MVRTALGLTLFVVVVCYVFMRAEPWHSHPYVLFWALSGVAAGLSRLLHRRPRLAYGLHAAGMLGFHAGMIVLIVGLGIRGEWFWF